MEKSNYIAFQIIYFFSMSKDDQSLLIGETSQQWFIEESCDNIGANYLIGICLSLLEYVNGAYFTENDTEEIDDLRKTVSCISGNLDPKYWRFEDLSEAEEWKMARSLANKIIDKLKPILHQIKKPFVIENLIYVDEYVHRSQLRKLLRKKGKKKWQPGLCHANKKLNNNRGLL